MFIKPIQTIKGLNQINELSKTTNENKDNLSFKSMFSNALENYVEAESKVDEDVHKLSVGESDALHNLMINTQKAEVSLDLVIQLRNKALDTYNEIMRMGV